MPDKTTHQIVLEVQKDVGEVKQALKGYNGQIGLCKQIENNTKQIAKLWIVIVAITVSLGGGIWGIVQLIMQGI